MFSRENTELGVCPPRRQPGTRSRTGAAAGVHAPERPLAAGSAAGSPAEVSSVPGARLLVTLRNQRGGEPAPEGWGSEGGEWGVGSGEAFPLPPGLAGLSEQRSVIEEQG